VDFQPDYLALSSYFVFLIQSTAFNGLMQQIEWFPTANEASFFADRWYGRMYSPAAALDLSSLGDGAEGIYAPGTGSSTTAGPLSSSQRASSPR
jgi:hypothetical protein